MPRNPARSLKLRLASRVFWLFLVLMHIPALFGAGRSLAEHRDLVHGASFVAVFATISFFVLSLAGVRFFPHSNARLRAVIFVLIAAFVHHGAAASAAQKLIASPAPAALATSVLAVESVRRSRRHLTNFKRSLTALLASHLNEAYVQGVIALVDLPRPRATQRHCLSIPRAPPA